MFRSLHEPGHHGYESSLRKIAQRFWWPRVRADMSAFVKDCKVCDRDRSSNLAARSHLEHLPADQPFAVLYIDIVGNQISLSLGALPKSILTIIDKLTGWAKAIPIRDQSVSKVARLCRPSRSRDTKFRINCIQIAEYNLKQQYLHIFAQPSESRKPKHQRTGFRQTEYARNSTGLWWRCCVELFKNDRMTKNPC